ncbi:MAG TPA: GNAT family N-acetyltransferase [Ktedonobacterales bacterium]
MQLRPIAIHELARVEGIDVSESGSAVYSVVESQLILREETWQRPHRSATHWQPYIEHWEGLMEQGGAAIGAFADSRLVGIAVIRYHLTESMAQLDALFVDGAYRRRGVATALVEDVSRLARASGAQELYVSATPSESAVGFYTSQGFALARPVNAELYEREPDDIHMVRALSS